MLALTKFSNREVLGALNNMVTKSSDWFFGVCARLSKNGAGPEPLAFSRGEIGLFYDGLAPTIKGKVLSSTVDP